MENKLGENIRKLRNSRGITQQKLAEIMGASNYTTVSKWESGSNSPRGGDLVKLSELFNVSVDELLGLSDSINIQKNKQYNLFPTYISAGLPFSVDGISQAEKISIPDSVMGKWAGNKDIFITHISGDSMDRVMNDGSMIAVKPITLDEIKNGDMVVFSNEHEYSVKYFRRVDDKLIFSPASNNDAHYEQHYSIDDNITIHGKVVMYIVELD